MLEVEIDKILALNELSSSSEQIAKNIQNPENPDNLYVFIGEDDKPVAAMINIDYLKRLTGKDKIAVKKASEEIPAPTPATENNPFASEPEIPTASTVPNAPADLTPEPMPASPMPVPEIPPIAPAVPSMPASPQPEITPPSNPTPSATIPPAINNQPNQTPPNLDIPV